MIYIIVGVTVIIILVCIGFLHYTRRIRKINDKLEEVNEIIEALSRDFPFVVVADFDEDTVVSIKYDGKVIRDSERVVKHEYDRLWTQFINEHVAAEEQRRLIRQVSKFNISKIFRHKDEHKVIYGLNIDGNWHTVQTTFVKIHSNSMNKEIVVIGFRVIDDIVKKEREQKEELKNALEDAVKSNQIKTSVLHDMTHDIRTPLNSIIGFASLAASNIDDKQKVSECITKITMSCEQLLMLLDNDSECNILDSLHNITAIDDIDKKYIGKRVLLAEDNELNQEITAEFLGAMGFKVDIAADGMEVIEAMLDAEVGYYDIILMDIQMPRLNGYEAAKQIRSLDRPEISDIPIIALTANATEEDVKNALNSGMNAHIVKPINVKVLEEKLSQFV